MRYLLVCISVTCLLAASGCGLIANLGNKNTQKSPTPSEIPTPKPDTDKPFRDATDALTKMPTMVRISGDGYIKGKPALFSQSISREVKEKKTKAPWTHHDFFSMKKIETAKSPDEVGTVILQKCEEISMGTFGQELAVNVVVDKIPAFGWKCEVTIIDKSIPAVVGRKTFETKKEEMRIVREGDKEITTSPPSVEIERYLNALPQKQ